jgi:hypothetical protein
MWYVFIHNTWSDGEDLKKKLWGIKEDLQKVGAFITDNGLKLWPLGKIEQGRRSCFSTPFPCGMYSSTTPGQMERI